MAAVSSIVLPDSQVTPVNHTFIPLGPDKSGTWHFEDQSGGIAAGFQRITLSLIRSDTPAVGKSATKVNRVRLTVTMPRLEVMSAGSGGYTPSPIVAYIQRANVEFLLPDRATNTDRKDARKYTASLLANAQVVAAIEELQNVY